MSVDQRLGVRWTIGDVSPFGFEALRLSIWGAWRVFGPAAAYAVCVNSLPLAEAQARTGAVPDAVRWIDATGRFPAFLRSWIDGAMAEGAGWKLAPLRVFDTMAELSLDNDCILWALPDAIRSWLDAPGGPQGCLMAEDVRACFGQFAPMCGHGPLNAGIRGLPAGFDLEAAMRGVLADRPCRLVSEQDEQGLQVAAASLSGQPHVVALGDVTICSPFPPHLPHLGRCGAHFVGLNAKQLPWDLDGRPAVDHIRAHWHRLRPAVYGQVQGAPPGTRCPLDPARAEASNGPRTHPRPR